MLVIGLTGRACAGKNQYASVFAEFGCAVVDVDLLGHQALEESKQALVREFGAKVVESGEVNRKVLGSLVFSDPAKLRSLERITHPVMVRACKARIEEARTQGVSAIVLNAALLSRMGLAALCDQVLFIKAPLWVRYKRCALREVLTLRRFLLRERAQKDISIKTLGRKAGLQVLHNRGSKALIHRQVATYCATIGISISPNG